MFVNILIINICYHDNLHACEGTEEFFFFTLLAGAPSLGKFPYSINVFPTKRCLFSVTLVWSPYVYSPCRYARNKKDVGLYVDVKLANHRLPHFKPLV